MASAAFLPPQRAQPPQPQPPATRPPTLPSALLSTPLLSADRSFVQAQPWHTQQTARRVSFSASTPASVASSRAYYVPLQPPPPPPPPPEPLNEEELAAVARIRAYAARAGATVPVVDPRQGVVLEHFDHQKVEKVGDKLALEADKMKKFAEK